MTLHEKIQAAIYTSIDEINEMATDGIAMEKSPKTPLFGAGATLDSIGLVNLLVTAEREVFNALDVSITIADERAISREKSPFRNVAALSDCAQELLEEASA